MPPLIGVAVKVVDAPAHIGLLPLVIAIETEGIIIGFTTTLIEFEVAVLGLAHVAVDVITQLTVCAFVKLEVVNIALLLPALVPFTNH